MGIFQDFIFLVPVSVFLCDVVTLRWDVISFFSSVEHYNYCHYIFLGFSDAVSPFSLKSSHHKILTMLRCLFNSDNCKTSIVNFHRSCPNPDCSCDICHNCCDELRKGLQPGGIESKELPESAGTKWKIKNDGSIPCLPKEHGGCGMGSLALRRIFDANWVEKLIRAAEKFTSNYQLPEVDFSRKCSLCFPASSPQGGNDSSNVRQAACREYSQDNFLYCPNAPDLGDAEFKHFQMHWRRGEPVIVRNALAMSSGLSWEPMVMLRAFKNATKKLKQDHFCVKAIDCLDWCEVR